MNKRKTSMKPQKPSMKKLILLVTVILTALILTALVTALLTAHLLAPSVYDADIRLSLSCSPADAIIAANHDRPEGGCPAGSSADTIALTQDITLRDKLPVITSDITIEGNGYTISGDNRWWIFYNAGGALTIKDLTMTKGYGSAIYNGNGELSISDSTFSGNSAEAGGAIYNNGKLSIVNSTFSGNSARGRGGAIANQGELSISDSAFSHNSADKGGAMNNWDQLSIVNSTFSGNSADWSGGAIANADKLSINSSTFSGNSAGKGGAVANWGELSMTNSIIAGRGGTVCRSSNELKRNISNFIQDGSCSPAFSGDPKLGELVEPEDGSPAYFPLLAGSPAIDAADDGYCSETDQIGTVRPQDAGCDIGAIEYVAP